jgi:Uma2 family endonuclease
MFKRLDALLAELNARGDASGLEAVEIETGYRIGLNQWLQPDVSITRTGQPAGEYYEGAPALAVEIISESNRASQVSAKIHEYLTNGGLEVWVIYPQTGHAVIHRSSTPHAISVTGRFQSELLPGMIIDLDEVLGPAE